MSGIIKCFLTVAPNELFYNFVKQLPDIDNTYICIDNNKHNIPNYDNKVKIIKIDNKIAEDNGFKNTHSRIKGSTSREKALYYFYINDLSYNHIWFIEEDVFIPTLDTIKNIDLKYPDNDLLVRNHEICNEKRTNWHWNLVNEQLRGKIDLPYAWALGAGICAIRCSKKFLECIFNYALKHKTLFFCEVMFNTLSLHNNLDVKDIDELKTIVYRKKDGWQKHEIDVNNLYHPVKCMNKQYSLRE